MKLLVVHPQDDLLSGPWRSVHWDRIIDIGRSGAGKYQEAAAHYRCSVTALDDLRDGLDETRAIRALFSLGRSRVQDKFGLDWWELLSILFHEELEVVLLLKRLVQSLGSTDQIHVTRSCYEARALDRLLARPVRVFSGTPDTQKKTLSRYLTVLRKFDTNRLLDIAWDKADPGYQLRAHWSRAPKPQTSPVVLLPSAYINVTRTGCAYAQCLPETNFLLVATRRSGYASELPPNVTAKWLRSYALAPSRERKLETARLLDSWEALSAELQKNTEFQVLADGGIFDQVRENLVIGLQVRDAWRNVFDREPVSAVFCADDTNPYTHIPLLLAKSRGLPTVACHHGALDGRHLFKRNHAGYVLAKGEMERDYLVNVCGLDDDVVEIAAPPSHEGCFQVSESEAKSKPYIVFFSEDYEVLRGRSLEFYEDLLPPLADLATQHGKKLLIKLHPAESLCERTRFVQKVLSPRQKIVVQLITGPLRPELLDDTWFAITVSSSVAVECASRGVSCFLCKWLECCAYGYIDQYVRFGAGIPLDGPLQIQEIPKLLAQHHPSSGVRNRFSTRASKEHLQQLLGLNGLPDVPNQAQLLSTRSPHDEAATNSR